MATTFETLQAAAVWLHYAYDTPAKVTLTAAQATLVTDMMKGVDEALKPANSPEMPASMRMPMTTNPPQGML